MFLESLSPRPIIPPLLSLCTKGMDHIVSHVKASFQDAKKLDSIKGGKNTPAEHAASMATRVVEREESMALSA